jgi:hypothetical protein
VAELSRVRPGHRTWSSSTNSTSLGIAQLTRCAPLWKKHGVGAGRVRVVVHREGKRAAPMTLLSRVDCALSRPLVCIGRRHRRLELVGGRRTPAWESRLDTPAGWTTAEPPGRAACPSPPPSPPSPAAPPPPPAAPVARALTGSPAQVHAPPQRSEGRECVPCRCGAFVHLCTPWIRAGGAQRDVAANP